MADGLLSNAMQALKNQYQETKGNVGLLMSDPKRYMSGLNQDAAEYNRLSSLALQAERNAYRGLPVSAEQTAAKQYIDQQQQDMALAFAAPIVYHGTPHLFAPTPKNALGEFNANKIGTGEGNQMYGYGHYLGGAKGTGEKYQKDVSRDYKKVASGELFDPFTLEHRNIRSLVDRNKFDEALNLAKEVSSSDSSVAASAQKDLLKLQDIQSKGGFVPNKGYLYTVDLPDSSARRMLDYDKELKSQPKHIRNLATQYGVDLNDIGFDLIQKVGNSPKGSEIMRNSGIPGVKYLDEGSRGNFKAQTTYKGNTYGDVMSFATKKQLDDYIAEKGKEGFGVKILPQTSNYVVFPKNEGLLTIKNRSN